MSKKISRLSKADILYKIGFAILIVTLLYVRFCLVKITVPTGSMLPAIELGDVIFCTKVRNPDGLERGDILAFYSDELDMMLIKRLIGLPGEIVDLRDGTVFVDGIPLEEEYVLFFDSSTNGTFEVPEGHYLFLGDNRRNSNDARYWEDPYIAFDKIKAKAGFRIAPSGRLGFVE